MLDRSILVRPAFLAAAGAMLMAGTIPGAVSAKNHSDSATTASTITTGDQPDKKICLGATVTGSDTITGSLLPKRVCKTKAEWEAQGVVFKAK